VEIQTTRFGALTVDPQKIIHMPAGMLGFPGRLRYVLLQHKENSPFFWYQAVDDPELAFVVASPFFIKPDYRINLKRAAAEMRWAGNDLQRIDLYVVITIPNGSPERMTANLIGPVVINNRKQEAFQYVVTGSVYTHRHAVFGEGR